MGLVLEQSKNFDSESWFVSESKINFFLFITSFGHRRHKNERFTKILRTSTNDKAKSNISFYWKSRASLRCYDSAACHGRHRRTFGGDVVCDEWPDHRRYTASSESNRENRVLEAPSSAESDGYGRPPPSLILWGPRIWRVPPTPSTIPLIH